MTNEVKKDALLNLANIFDNAADNGLLLLNYPMCEAYRDCCIPNIEDYRNKFIGINDSINYKKIVHERNTCMDINKYKKDQFTFIQACNIKKTNHVCTDHYSFANYDNFLTCCSQHNILEHVFNQIDKEKTIPVLNTMSFISIDLYGEPEFNSIVAEAQRLWNC